MKRRHRLGAAVRVLALWLASGSAAAATEAHVIRVDTGAMDSQGTPLLTTLAEVGDLGPNGFLPKPFPEADAVLELEGAARPAEMVDRTPWPAKTDAGFGTAWLVVLDTEGHMGPGLGKAKDVALALIDSLRANDAVCVVILDDRRIAQRSKWLGAAARAEAAGMVRAGSLAPSARNRGFSTLLETAARDGFGALGGASLPRGVPLHQTMLVLSTGYGGADPKTTGPGGAEIARALERGRFPENNTSAPKTPVPVVSVAFAFEALPEHRHNALELMKALPSPRIGGSFHSVQAADVDPSKAILGTVRARFDAMQVVRWRLPCVAPAPTQSLRLEFPRARDPIVGDATFRDVPLGAPLRFALAVDRERTRAEAEKAGGVVPGGRVRVYGRFCWGTSSERAKGYFLPRGTLVPESLQGSDLARLEQARTDLVTAGLAGGATRTEPSFVEISVPEDPRILWGGSTPVVRLVLEDASGPRTSGITKSTVIELRAKKPTPRWAVWAGAMTVLAIAFGCAKRHGRRARRPRDQRG